MTQDVPCVYADTATSTENDYVHYHLAATLYVESGELHVKRSGIAGTVVYYDDISTVDYVGTFLNAGAEFVLSPGDSLFLEDAAVKFWTTATAGPTIIYVTGFNVRGGPPSCAGVNCWIPS